MLSANGRTLRINDVLHKELAKIINSSCQDPRLGMVTISEVLVSSDLGFAKVYVTVLEIEKQQQSLSILNKTKTKKFFRAMLAKNLTLRTVPELKFVFDQSLTTGCRIEELLDDIREK